MVTFSVLFEIANDPRRISGCEMPKYFQDLNLDQLVGPIAASRPDYALSEVFFRPLKTSDEVKYRQELFKDLDSQRLREALSNFSEHLRNTRRILAGLEKIYSTWHRRGWFIEAVREYTLAIDRLRETFDRFDPVSRALSNAKSYLADYLSSEPYRRLSSVSESLESELSKIQYCVIIKDLTVRVQKYEGEFDFGTEIENTFSRFSQGSVKNYFMKYPEASGVNHVEAQILDCVAKLYPALFSRVKEYCASHEDFIDETIDNFDKDIQFYLSWLEYIEPLKNAGLDFCLPEISASDKAIYGKGIFDVVLAKKLAVSAALIVKNDFRLDGPERVFVVTGPNQGGKTTFARTFGQLHHLAALGLPVPGTEARLFLFDHIFTQFEREESLKSQKGKLHEELTSLHASLEAASSRSIFVLNEIFTSTTVVDSLFLSRRIMEQIAALDTLGVCVTFLDELASIGEKFVSLVSGVDSEDHALRTFKMERRPADGLAYARSLAEKRRLTYMQLKGRIPL